MTIPGCSVHKSCRKRNRYFKATVFVLMPAARSAAGLAMAANSVVTTKLVFQETVVAKYASYFLAQLAFIAAINLADIVQRGSQQIHQLQPEHEMKSTFQKQCNHTTT